MEFNIRKGATLPFIEINLIKDGRSDYDYTRTNLTGSTIYFYMKDIDTGIYRILNSIANFSINDYTIYYQFTKKNTSKTGRFEGGFKIFTDQGLIDLPITDKIYVNILESISNTDFCCGPNKNIGPIITPTPVTPTPTPSPSPTPTPSPSPTPNVNGIYYGKFSGTSITSGQVVSNLTFTYTNSVVNSYVGFPVSVGQQYGYTLIPVGFTQPSQFRNSNNGCDGLIIPTPNIGQVIINNINNVPITYNIYRTFYDIYGGFNSWMCA